MASLSIKNTKIVGMSACVPKEVAENEKAYAKWGGYEDFVATTGVKAKRIADDSICSSDLCIAAAEELINKLGWEKDEIDAIIFVSQTADYLIPSTAPIIQDRLGLSKNCYTLDISLGCSGWVYALSVITSLMQNGTIKRGILLAGDTIQKYCNPNDKSTWPLFGDAGSATALEYDEKATDIYFLLYSDGSGFEDIIIKDKKGGRNNLTNDSLTDNKVGEGIIRSHSNLEMDGLNIFSFGLSKVPKLIKEFCSEYNINLEEIDNVGFHQANMLMNEKIKKKLKLRDDQVPYSLQEFGNTSCASIPLSLVTQCANKLSTQHQKNIGCGFGVGLSWGAVYFETDCIVVPNLIEI